MTLTEMDLIKNYAKVNLKMKNKQQISLNEDSFQLDDVDMESIQINSSKLKNK